MIVFLNRWPWSSWWDRAGPLVFTRRVRRSSPVSGKNKCNLYWWHFGPGNVPGVSRPLILLPRHPSRKMGKPFQIRITWPLRGKEKVLLRGATQKSFLGRQKPRVSSREGSLPPVPLLHVRRFRQVWYPRILQREFLYERQDFANNFRNVPRCNVCEKIFVITSSLP